MDGVRQVPTSEGGAKLQGGRLSLVLHQLFQLLKLADHFTGMGEEEALPVL